MVCRAVFPKMGLNGAQNSQNGNMKRKKLPILGLKGAECSQNGNRWRYRVPILGIQGTGKRRFLFEFFPKWELVTARNSQNGNKPGGKFPKWEV